MEILYWLLLEAIGAAALIALLVWWTWPRKRKPENDDTGDEKPK